MATVAPRSASALETIVIPATAFSYMPASFASIQLLGAFVVITAALTTLGTIVCLAIQVYPAKYFVKPIAFDTLYHQNVSQVPGARPRDPRFYISEVVGDVNTSNIRPYLPKVPEFEIFLSECRVDFALGGCFLRKVSLHCTGAGRALSALVTIHESGYLPRSTALSAIFRKGKEPVTANIKPVGLGIVQFNPPRARRVPLRNLERVVVERQSGPDAAPY